MATGIYKTATGFRVIASICRGADNRKDTRFPQGTPVQKMKDWQIDARKALTDRAAGKAQVGSFADDVERQYLPIKKAGKMPSFTTRAQHMALWVAVLNGKDITRDLVKPVQIRAALATWQLQHGWTNAYLNRIRTALMDFYSIVNGKSGFNPVRDVPKLKERRRQAPPEIDYDLFDQILDAMPDMGRSDDGGERPGISLTKLRLRVLATTGLPHKQIGELSPKTIDWDGRRVLIASGRDKGAGTDATWLPVSNTGMAALRAFADAGAWGKFSAPSMLKAFRKGLAKVKPGSRLTPYQCRHLFGTTLVDVSGDRKWASKLLLHTSEATTAIYTEAAEQRAQRATLDAYDRAMAARAKKGQKTGRKRNVLSAGFVSPAKTTAETSKSA